MSSPDPAVDKVRVVSASRLIAAPATTIFELLATPSRHVEIDGSGTIRHQRIGGPSRLSLGAKFGMDMKVFRVPYRITNVVVEFEEGQRIAWRHFGRHIWRYVLEPRVDASGADAGQTLVTESFDWASTPIPLFYQLVGYPRAHEANMARTLERLEAAVTTPA